MKYSIIIPAHNEGKRISRTLEDYGRFFKNFRREAEIIVVLNACKDNTLEIVKKFRKKYSQIRYLNFRQAGKGFAVIEGFKAAKGEIIGFTDADDSTSASEYGKLIKEMNGYDGIIASRWMKESIVSPKQPISRIIASRIFNFLVRALFSTHYQDTQCGAKIFKKEAIKKVIPSLGITQWAFDIDLLYNLKRKKCMIKEFPIRWMDKEASKLKVSKTGIEMLAAIFRLRLIYSPFRFLVRAYDMLPEFIKIHHRLI